MDIAPLYIAILLLALVAAGAILYRRRQSRRALVQRVADLSQLAEVGRAIISAPLDLQSLAEVVYQQAGQIVDTSIFQLGLFEGNRYRLLIWVLDGERQPLQEFRLMPDSLGIVGWLRESKRSLLVRDFESEQDSLPAKPRYIAERPPRSAAFVPLMVADSVLGAIAIQSRRPNAFDDEHVRLLTIVANHAAAALEKAHVYEQAQERASHLALIAEVTQQINVLQPLPALYKQIVECIAKQLEGYEVSFFTPVNNGLKLQATSRPDWKGKTIVRRTGDTGNTVVEAAGGRQTVVRESLPEMGGDGNDAPASHKAELAIPVVIEEKVMGVLHGRATGATVAPSVRALFESLAAQIAFAILESELYAAEQRRAEQLATIAQVSRTIVSNLELEELFDEVLDRIEDSFGFKRAHIFLLQEHRLVFRAGLGKGAARWSARGMAHDLSGPGLIALAGRTQQAVIAGDVNAHAHYVPGPGLEDTRSEMAAPMIMGDKLLGVFDVQSDKLNQFGVDDAQIFQTLANTLAVAVRNARLFDLERRRRYLAETM
ncbi:MAG TPA: GAF domain-containing protein, partial [Anaerolineales bacterium]|nr:GAF domain-containing protein [Anaerolineales bacterium]